jgi:hypothetical protein
MPPRGWRKGDGLARDRTQESPATRPETAQGATQTPIPAPGVNLEQKEHGGPLAAVYGPSDALSHVKFQDAVVVGGRIIASCLADQATTIESTDRGVVIRRAGAAVVIVPWANVVSAAW